MKITCPSCSAKYTIADEKVRGRTVKIKCKKCGSTISAGPDDGAAGASAETNLAAASGGEWMVNVGEGDQRTLSSEQIAELFQQGSISGETYVWRDGMAEWLPLASVQELASVLPAAPAPAPAPDADEMDDAMPTMMAPAYGFNPAAAAAPRPAAGAAPAPAPAAARRSAPRGKDLFGSSDDGVAAGFAAPTASGPPPPRRPEPPMPGAINSDEASGILDIRKLQGAMGSAPEAPRKDEKVDDIMNLGGGALFSSPIAPPDFSNALAPPDFSAPPPPEPPKPVAAMAAAPMPVAAAPLSVAAPQKSKAPLMILGAVAFLAVGIGGTVLVMGSKKPPEEDGKTAAVASADSEKKSADTAAKPEEKKAEAQPSSHPEEKKDDKKPESDTEAEPPPGKELTPEEKKRRDEAFKKKKEEIEKKKKDEEEKKKKEEEEKKKKAEAETAAAAAAAAPGGDKPFDRAAANSALSSIASSAASCKKADGPTGSGKVAVTFAPSGKATTATIEGSFAGTSVGSCVAGRFRSAKVPPFSGSPVTVKKTFTIN